MKKTGIFSLLLLLVTTAWAQPSPTVPAALKETKVSNAELLKWTFNGIGKVYDESGRQICLQEGENSLGVGLYSPLSYKGDVVMRYKVMPLNAATVLVNLLCMSDEGESLELTFPDGYDGSMGPILNKEDYFIAFRNSPHATAPFISKNPKAGQLAIADKLVWLKVDGKTVVQCTDPNILPGGHLGIRLRGLVGHPAACVIRDLSILSAQ